MNNIMSVKAECWCSRLSLLMKKRGYTQKTLLREYKEKYGSGTQANISRWLRVGSVTGNGKKIGFPSFETMINLADLFNVSVGYLIGETDNETFEMEQICQYTGLTEEAVNNIEGITSGKAIPLHGKHLSKELKVVFENIINTSSFKTLIFIMCEYMMCVDSKEERCINLKKVQENMSKDMYERALACIDYEYIDDENYGYINDFEDNGIELTEELISSINILRNAREADFVRENKIEADIELLEYKMQKTYFELIKEVLSLEVAIE